MKKYLKITIMLVILLAICTLTSTVNATYQSRPNVNSTRFDINSIERVFYNIRKMENDGQTLGLVETIDETTGLSTNGSNGIDCHMMKNTEYGPIAILSSSIYGNAPQGYGSSQNGEITTSTTQNATGVFQMVNESASSGARERREVVAAVEKDTMAACALFFLTKLNSSYVDIYDNISEDYTDYSASKVGDAIKETLYWYGAESKYFITYGWPILVRGFGGLFNFSYNGITGTGLSSRAVVVCGDGI